MHNGVARTEWRGGSTCRGLEGESSVEDLNFADLASRNLAAAETAARQEEKLSEGPSELSLS